jgi:hypothetical protein
MTLAKSFRMMVARDGVERFSGLCNQQLADYTMDRKDKLDSKDILCVRFVCGSSSNTVADPPPVYGRMRTRASPYSPLAILF